MKKIYIITIILAVIIIVLFLFFSSLKNSELTELKQNDNGNFALHISNQSFAIDPVDIKIFIDDKLAVNQNFYVDTQHTYVSFRYSLSTGEHKIRIESKKGDATFEQSFEIVDKHSGVVEYWYYPETHYEPTPKYFTFSFGEDLPLLID